ncbi:hypothetical protein BDV10DRAFT_69672 [Aspergillus recurvatus]
MREQLLRNRISTGGTEDQALECEWKCRRRRSRDKGKARGGNEALFLLVFCILLSVNLRVRWQAIFIGQQLQYLGSGGDWNAFPSVTMMGFFLVLLEDPESFEKHEMVDSEWCIRPPACQARTIVEPEDAVSSQQHCLRNPTPTECVSNVEVRSGTRVN